MDRKTILKYAQEKYKATPEYLWERYPEDAVLRHFDNKKWFAVIMNIQKCKIGINSDENVDIINVKCDPATIGSLQMVNGIFPGYHMNKGNWISVLLDGSVDENMIYTLLDGSYELTAGKKK